jgi:spermidine/putrescine transport system permease protein
VLRVLAWKIILGTTANGVLNSVLLNLGIISKPIAILYTGTAIVFGLVYLSIPFMLLPLYAVLGKVPESLLEASEDLGATRTQTFVRVVLPLTRSGTITAVTLTFLLSLGDVLASQTLGGGRELMIGAVMFQTYISGLNWTLGSALAITVFAAILLIVAGLAWVGRERKYNA